MLKRIIASLLAIALLVIPGCAVTDDVSSSYNSVVALSKSIGDMWLLAGGTLKGITEDGLELEGASDVAVVGTVTQPNLEAILELEPDLVLVSAELSSHAEIKAELDNLGIDTIAVAVNSFDDYDSYMKTFAEFTGRADLYELNVTSIRNSIDEIISLVPSAGEGLTYLAIRVSATKNKVLKNDYFACGIFNDLGLNNVVTDNSELDEISAEWIAGADPDIIFVVLHGQEDEAMDSFTQAFESSAFWGELTAVSEGRVFVLPKDYFQYKPNALWADAYQYAYDLIYEG
ncbi:MAG: ABC transporter substrate-binding protein [Clostridiales bacterium]|nr:ABC transporter substrate-binding protein [Clostridiales bacterium]